MLRRIVATACIAVAIALPSVARAQQPGELVHQLNRSGPRFGVTWLGGSLVDTLKSKYDIDVSRIITQSGWQYERQFGNFENGVGPNATPAGVALAMSMGMTFRAGALNVPVNVAVVPSRFGVRASILTGFNLYR